MNSSQVTRWLTIGANLSVLAGIVLLGVELDQSRQIVIAQTRHSIATDYIDFVSASAYDADMADIILRHVRGQPLTPVENYQYSQRFLSFLLIAESVHYQYEQGLFDEDELAAVRRSWVQFADISTSVGGGDNWCRFRENLRPTFRAEMDSIFVEVDCE